MVGLSVSVVNPPFLPNYSRMGRWPGGTSRTGGLSYPMWLAYAVGVLEQAGHDVTFVDAIANGWDLKETIDEVTSAGPDMVVVETNFSSVHNDCAALSMLKKRTDAVGVMAGPPAQQYAERMVELGADIVIAREYEHPLKELADQISVEGRPDTGTPAEERIIRTDPSDLPDSQELDDMPFVTSVYKGHLRPRDYFINIALYPMVQVLSGRGCPGMCTFCSWPTNFSSHRYRGRSVGNFVDELEYVSRELPGVKDIYIEDDCFTLDTDRVLAICDEIERRGLRVRWTCHSRADLEPDVLKRMKQAGCRCLDVGFESGSDLVLNNINKGYTVKETRHFATEVKRAGIKLAADFVIGFPGETREGAQQTIDYIKELRPDLLQVAIATPIPGTPFHAWCKQNDFLLTEDVERSIDEYGSQRCSISYPWLGNEEIEQLAERALREYLFSPAYVKTCMVNLYKQDGLDEVRNVMRSAMGGLKGVLCRKDGGRVVRGTEEGMGMFERSGDH